MNFKIIRIETYHNGHFPPDRFIEPLFKGESKTFGATSKDCGIRVSPQFLIREPSSNGKCRAIYNMLKKYFDVFFSSEEDIRGPFHHQGLKIVSKVISPF